MSTLPSPVESPETVVVEGADRERFLNAYLTADVRRATARRRIEGFFSARDGRVLSPAGVTPIDEALWVDVPPGQGSLMVEHLLRFVIADRVRISLGAQPAVRWLGPSDALDRLGDEQPQAGRGSWLGFDSLVVWGAAADTPGADSAVDLARIEAARPRFGVDYLSGDCFPQELGVWAEQLVDYQKGCYLGQEVIARIHWRGRVQRRPRVIELEAQATSGVAVRFEERDAGMLTSVVGQLGLAILHDRVPAGAIVEIGAGGRGRAR